MSGMIEKQNENFLINMKILYVEDEETTRNEMKQFLKRRAGKVILAENGKAGLEKFLEDKPDIVVADLLMPVMGGLEMIRRIREIDYDCPIAITTTRGDIESVLETVDIGISKYIIKPIDTDELLTSLEEMAQRVLKREKIEAVLEGDEKKKAEDSIKRAISYLIKNATGKGPKDVNAFIKGKSIEITAYDVLTAMEKSILENVGNRVLIEQNRKLFYSVKAKDIEAAVSDILGQRVVMHDTFINPVKGFDKIIMFIE